MFSSRQAALLIVVWLAAARAAAQPDGAGDANDEIGWGDTGPSASESPGGDDAVGWGASAPADEAPESDAAADVIGFDELASSPAEQRVEHEDLAVSHGGTLRLDGAVWTERIGDNGFAKGRASLDLWLRRRLPNGRLALGAHGEYDFAYLYQRDGYDRPTLDTYEYLVRAGENFIALERPRGTLAVGTQVVVFGHADTLSVVDLVNPHDLRESILTDLMDLRVPVLMTRGAYTADRLRLELLVVHEAWFELVPPPFGTWSPIRRHILEDPRVTGTVLPDLLPMREVQWEHAQRRLGLESQQVFGRFTTSAGPVDLGLYAAVYRDPIGTVTLPTTQEILLDDVIAVRLDHLRVQTLAASMSFVHGSVVGWAEAAVDVRRPVNVEDEVSYVRTERRTLFRFNAGLRYQGPRNGVAALEYAEGTQRGPGPSDAELLVPILPTTLMARIDRAFAREKLRVRVAGAMTGELLRGGAIGLGELAWMPRDGFALSVGYAAFAPLRRESSLIWGYTTHDRAFARLCYDFAR